MTSSLTACDGDGATVVNKEQVAAVGRTVQLHLREHSPIPAKWDDPHYWNIDDADDARRQFLAVGNAINFRFWERPGGVVVPSVGLIDGELLRGSMYMWRRLRRAAERGEFSLDAHDLATLDEAGFAGAFADDEGRLPLRPGLEERVANLRDLGSKLGGRWQSQFGNVVRAAHGSLDRFAELSGEFRAFDDPVRKLTMVNAIMLAGSGLAKFDRDPVPGVDYHLVKQVLRQGLVTPTPAVVAKLAAKELIDPEESRTLRAAVLDALIKVADRAAASTAVLDNMYWANRRVCGDEQWLCDVCPFTDACLKRTEFGLPLELTRYY